MYKSMGGKLSELNRLLKIAFKLSFWLVIPYFSLAMGFVVRRVDPLYKGISPFQFGLIATVVFISAYPIFVWKRDTPTYPYLGKLSFAKWLFLGLITGILTVIIAFLLRVVANYSSS